jgi:hypothetical protein
VYALPQGVPVESIQLGGIGQPSNRAPFPGCFPIFIGSDSGAPHFGDGKAMALFRSVSTKTA